MKIENQCCTLQQAKRLKQLGVEQNSYCLLIEFPDSSHVDPRSLLVSKASGVHFNYSFYSAFTVAELGVMLGEERAMVIESVHRTEAESRAEHLIWLLEEKHLTAEEVNKRLRNE